MKSRTRIAATLAMLALFAAVGCSPKLTRERFDRIGVETATRADVRDILGEPSFDTGDEWLYRDKDRLVSAHVFFSSAGRVQSKEWIDVRAGTWESGRPGDDAVSAFGEDER
ncbi:MAG: hypothetical protein AB7Q17_00130 [Phycisphaerae bacterium]